MQQFIKDHLKSTEHFKLEMKNLKDKVSANDKEINNLYHMLEVLKLNAVYIAKISKKLSAALKLRRTLKEDLNICQVIVNSVVEKTLPLEEFERRTEERAVKYAEEAQNHFDEMFKKVV